MNNKVSVVGAGFVGTMTAQRIVEKDLADVVLVDIVEGVPQGKALDIAQSAPIEGFAAKVAGTNDFSLIRDSRVVVVTAGFPRAPGMTREELALKNGGVVRSVAEKIRLFAPGAIILMVTNPLDLMAHLAFKVSGFPAGRVIGMGGVLDSARYRYLIAEELDIPAGDVQALVLGSHGDAMIPLERYATVGGMPAAGLIKKEKFSRIIERTKNSGAEIVGLLRTGSAFMPLGGRRLHARGNVAWITPDNAGLGLPGRPVWYQGRVPRGARPPRPFRRRGDSDGGPLGGRIDRLEAFG